MSKVARWSTVTEFDESVAHDDSNGIVVGGGIWYGKRQVRPYLTTERLQQFTQKWLYANKYTRWIYILVYDGGNEDGDIGRKLRVKVGESTVDFLRRYDQTCNTYNYRVIDVFPSNVGDKVIHKWVKMFSPNGVVNPEAWRCCSEEVYEVVNAEALNDLIERVHEESEYEDGIGPRHEMKTYNDIFDLSCRTIEWCISFYNEGNRSPHINFSLCPRLGKTNTYLTTWLLSGVRISIMTSYVGTVMDSYASMVKETIGYECIKVIDTTTFEGRKAISKAEKWLAKNPMNRVLFLVPLTGTDDEEDIDESTFSTRTTEMIHFIESMLKNGENFCIGVDECDFGAHCEKQVKKIQRLTTIGGMEAAYKMSMSGTNASYANSIWGSPNKIENIGYLELAETVSNTRKGI